MQAGRLGAGPQHLFSLDQSHFGRAQVEQAVDLAIDPLLAACHRGVEFGDLGARLGDSRIPLVALREPEFAFEALGYLGAKVGTNPLDPLPVLHNNL